MSTFDQLAGLDQRTEFEVQPDSVQTEAADPEAAEGSQNLDEMFGMHPRRYLNPRDLQYGLEDAKTTCHRMWLEQQRYKEKTEGLEAAHNKLQKALQAAAEAAKAYADAQDAKYK